MKELDYFFRLWNNPYVRKTAKGSVAVFTMTMLAAVLGYAIRMVLSRQLRLEDFGLFYAVFTFVAFFRVFKDLGLNQALAKFIPEFKVEKKFNDLKSIIIYALITNIIAATILGLIWTALSKYLATAYFHNLLAAKLLPIFAIYFAVSVISDIFAVSCLGFQKNFFYSIKLFIINLIVLTTVIVAKNTTAMKPTIAYLIAVIITAMIYAFFFRISFNIPKSKFVFDKKLYKKLIIFGLPLTFTIAGTTIISYVDVLMLTFFRTLEEVGVYNAVMPSAALFSTIGGSIGIVLLPVISEMWAKSKHKEVNKGISLIHRYLILFMIPLVALIFIFSKLILEILFGPEFIAGSTAFRILIIGAAFNALLMINNRSIIAKGMPKKATKVIIVAALLNIILNAILIPLYGMTGAAAATSISYFIGFIFAYVFQKSSK